ncbi:HalOD1 output domain-containing protein [Haladaptatus sp. NG-SE-30]
MSENCSIPKATQTYRAYHDTSRQESICVTICKTISAIENVDIENLDITLQDHLDVDALETLTANATPNDEWRFTVTIDRYRITIHNDGEIVVKDKRLTPAVL